MLANDPHLEFSTPATWYMVHLTAPGLDVTGASLPGVPAVIIGHNDRIAWGVTNLQFDVQDLYREQINSQTGRYLYRGQPEQARLERGAIGSPPQAGQQAGVARNDVDLPDISGRGSTEDITHDPRRDDISPGGGATRSGGGDNLQCQPVAGSRSEAGGSGRRRFPP